MDVYGASLDQLGIEFVVLVTEYFQLIEVDCSSGLFEVNGVDVKDSFMKRLI